MIKNVFIGGPITHLLVDHVIDSDFKRLHENAVSSLEKNGYNVFSAHITEKYGECPTLDDVEIFERDISWIDNADLCIFILPTKNGNPIRTEGTYIEIGYALGRHRPCIIFWDTQYKELYSPMFRGINGGNVQLFDINIMGDVINSLAL